MLHQEETRAQKSLSEPAILLFDQERASFFETNGYLVPKGGHGFHWILDLGVDTRKRSQFQGSVTVNPQLAEL